MGFLCLIQPLTKIQLALELSAREDPEATQIEAIKQFSLGSCAPENSPAELIAYRYWNNNCLGYDDKILDGFYDLYGVLNASSSERIPPLLHLQGTPVSEGVTWEALLVNRSGDSNLLRLEHMALDIAAKSKSKSKSVSSKKKPDMKKLCWWRWSRERRRKRERGRRRDDRDVRKTAKMEEEVDGSGVDYV